MNNPNQGGQQDAPKTSPQADNKPGQQNQGGQQGGQQNQGDQTQKPGQQQQK